MMHTSLLSAIITNSTYGQLQETIMIHNNCGSAAMGKLSVRVQLDWAEPLGHAFQGELEGAGICRQAWW